MAKRQQWRGFLPNYPRLGRRFFLKRLGLCCGVVLTSGVTWAEPPKGLSSVRWPDQGEREFFLSHGEQLTIGITFFSSTPAVLEYFAAPEAEFSEELSAAFSHLSCGDFKTAKTAELVRIIANAHYSHRPGSFGEVARVEIDFSYCDEMMPLAGDIAF